MPAMCRQCRAANPPESRFCHRCGAALAAAHTPLHPPPRPRGRQPRIGDIGADLKNLGADVAAYSAPRIKKGSIATARAARAAAAYSAPRVKSLAQRLKPYRAESPAPSLPIPDDSAVADAGVEADGGEYQLPSQSAIGAIACPRCHRVSEPGALFCFSCGLPLDEEPAATAHRGGAYAGQPAGFWMRFVAWAIDFILLFTVQTGIIAIWPGFREYLDAGGGLHWVYLLTFILTLLYYTIGIAVWATTVGKRCLGLYALRPNGEKAGFGRALGRYLAGILSGLIFGIGYLMIGLRSDKLGLHDLICDTVVVRK